jgi:hypothetical protein
MDPEVTKRVMLRGFAVVGGGLALVLAVLGFFPGYEVYRDGALAGTHAVADSPTVLAVLLAGLAAMGAYVWRRPLLANALLWSMASVGLAVFVLALTGLPGPVWGEDPVVVLPAAELASRIVLALVLVQLLLLPLACGLFALATRPPRPERIARARVHRMGR